MHDSEAEDGVDDAFRHGDVTTVTSGFRDELEIDSTFWCEEIFTGKQVLKIEEIQKNAILVRESPLGYNG